MRLDSVALCPLTSRSLQDSSNEQDSNMSTKTKITPRNMPYSTFGFHAPEGERMNVDEFLDAAGMNWDVEMREFTIDGHSSPDDNFRATVRSDTGERLGIVSKSFHPTPNRVAFDFLSTLVDERVLDVTAGATMKGGKLVAITARLPEGWEVDPGGVGRKIEGRLHISTGHDGNQAVRIGMAPLDIICANTNTTALRLAKKANAAFSIHHRSRVDGKIAAARDAIGLRVTQMGTWSEAATVLARTPMSDDEWETFLTKTLVADPADGAPPYVIDRADAKRYDIDAIYKGKSVDGEQSRNGDVTGTYYGAFSAVTEYLDWYRPVQKGDESHDDDAIAERMKAVLAGTQVAAKTKAWDVLARAANSKPERRLKTLAGSR